MLEAADQLMYEAKAAGGDDVCQREVRSAGKIAERPHLDSV
jgi:hypothetical protein